MMLNQPINMNPLIPRTPSTNSAMEEEDQVNYNTRKILSKLTSSPSRTTSINIQTTKLPDLKNRSKSTNIKPPVGDSYFEDASSLIDIKSMNVRSPRPNTVIIPSQKSEQ